MYAFAASCLACFSWMFVCLHGITQFRHLKQFNFFSVFYATKWSKSFRRWTIFQWIGSFFPKFNFIVKSLTVSVSHNFFQTIPKNLAHTNNVDFVFVYFRNEIKVDWLDQKIRKALPFVWTYFKPFVDTRIGKSAAVWNNVLLPEQSKKNWLSGDSVATVNVRLDAHCCD